MNKRQAKLIALRAIDDMIEKELLNPTEVLWPWVGPDDKEWKKVQSALLDYQKVLQKRIERLER